MTTATTVAAEYAVLSGRFGHIQSQSVPRKRSCCRQHPKQRQRISVTATKAAPAPSVVSNQEQDAHQTVSAAAATASAVAQPSTLFGVIRETQEALLEANTQHLSCEADAKASR